MSFRKTPLAKDHYYHIFSRSIAGFTVFNNNDDFLRIKEILNLYRFIDFNHKFCKFITLSQTLQSSIIEHLKKESPVLVEIAAYCIMPTHIHLILKQAADCGISKFMSNILNSYTRYFNVRHHRKGPLWEGHFDNVLVKTDDQMLHLTRYLHLNSTSAGIVDNPEDWPWSSYLEYIKPENKSFCNFEFLEIKPLKYKKFVNDRKSYQRELAIIKSLLIDNYTG